jgi:reverse transcriptase-like protein
MKTRKYSIEVVYKDLLGTTDKVCWATTVWNPAVIPRSRFVVWLAYHQRLKTKQWLKSMGVVDDDLCPICGMHPKTTNHLFFKCKFSAQCTKALVS